MDINRICKLIYSTHSFLGCTPPARWEMAKSERNRAHALRAQCLTGGIDAKQRIIYGAMMVYVVSKPSFVFKEVGGSGGGYVVYEWLRFEKVDLQQTAQVGTESHPEAHGFLFRYFFFFVRLLLIDKICRSLNCERRSLFCGHTPRKDCNLKRSGENMLSVVVVLTQSLGKLLNCKTKISSETIKRDRLKLLSTKNHLQKMFSI